MNDLKFAFRQLSRNPGSAAVAVLRLRSGCAFDSSKLTRATCPPSSKFQ